VFGAKRKPPAGPGGGRAAGWQVLTAV